ncbi:hypothetical protein A6F68_00496 [Tsuneonella dongtanensis]|uniref:Uncharacterized protein n=1 Tax=Tsuneonella dongtanensis TaxID=692370 RepID=A0A1B2AAA2_9SPHN|nr:hypothetical protein [Tsuneonella dongtanensis]ANY19031.1 hypothetical protein A6F68_00496 [Tsuneonella dongtanensis]
MTKPSPLDDPDSAAFAWGRWKRLMRLMGAVTAATVAMLLFYLWYSGTAMSIHFYIATGLGVSAAMMLMGALMGLVFMSNGTGHDDSVADPMGDRD